MESIASILRVQSFVVIQIPTWLAGHEWKTPTDCYILNRRPRGSLREPTMPHKFKIGTVVNYRPKDRMLSSGSGTYFG